MSVPYFSVKKISDIVCDIDKLCDFEKKQYLSFKSEKRRLEYLSSRIFAKNFIANVLDLNENKIWVLNDKDRKPYVCFDGKEFYISISHRGGYVGVAFNRDFNPFIGIDIEVFNKDKDYSFLYSYLTDFEKKHIKTTIDVIRLWSVKESVLKLFGKGLSVDTKLVEIIDDNISVKGSLIDLANNYKIDRINYKVTGTKDVIVAISWI